MLRIRAILALVLGVSEGAALWFLTHSLTIAGWVGINEAGGLFLSVVASVVLTYLAAGALVMFLATFCGMSTSPNGDLCYNPRNFWWRIMSSFYGKSWKKDGMRFCRAYWFTDLFLLICTMLIIATVAVGGIFYIFVTGTYDAIAHRDISSLMFLLALGGIAGYYGLMTWALSSTKRWLKYIGLALAVVLIVALSGLIIYAFVTSWSAQMGIVILSVFGGVGTAILIVWGAVRFVPKLWRLFKGTWIGKLLVTLDNKLCPVIVECPLPK